MHSRRGISNVISTILLVVAAIIAGSAILAYTNGAIGGFGPTAGVTMTGQLTVTGSTSVMTLNIQNSGGTSIKQGIIILPAAMTASAIGTNNGCTTTGASLSASLSTGLNPGGSATCYLTGGSGSFTVGTTYAVTITVTDSSGHTTSSTISLTASA